LKKFLFTLFVAATILAGCQKDPGTNVTIKPADLVSINSQLKGTWLFPAQTVAYVDNSGKSVLPSQDVAAPAFEFDGNRSVNIMPDTHTILKGTYTLSTNKGNIFLNIVYPDDTKVQYEVMQANNQLLKLNSTQPYTFYDLSGNAINASEVINTTLQRENSADVTGSLVRVAAYSDSTYSINIHVMHANSKVDTATLITNSPSVNGQYNYSFIGKPGDHVIIDMVGSPFSSSFYAYFNGLPVSGNIVSTGNEMTTSTGWDVP
jgi:hypothetical protein